MNQEFFLYSGQVKDNKIDIHLHWNPYIYTILTGYRGLTFVLSFIYRLRPFIYTSVAVQRRPSVCKNQTQYFHLNCFKTCSVD